MRFTFQHLNTIEYQIVTTEKVLKVFETQNDFKHFQTTSTPFQHPFNSFKHLIFSFLMILF